MTYTRTIVCLANSRKTSGRCIAGKEWGNGVAGAWFRPVSSRHSHEVSEEERRFQNGQDPRLLDIITIPCTAPQPMPHQEENHVLDAGYYWKKQDVLPWHQVDSLLDAPSELWSLGESSYAFLNNRVADGYRGGKSLYLIAVDELRLLVGAKSTQYPKRIVRGEFTYRGIDYRMAVTDPAVEKAFLERADGNYVIEDPRLCISLGDPYQGYFYKLIAAVLFQNRFR